MLLQDITLRECQRTACDQAKEFLRTAQPGDKLPFASPTGSGKTYMILTIRAETSGGVVVSPTDDILAGFAGKLGIRNPTKAKMEALGFYTPIRFRNLLLQGVIDRPTYLLIDELHHDDDTHKLIDELCANVPAIGFTATPYRGTAKATGEFLRRWGVPNWVIKLPQAVREGFISFPTCDIIPLLDDDVVEVRNGEFVVEQLDQQCEGVIGRLLGELDRLYNGGVTPDRPTMLVLPSVFTANLYGQALTDAGYPCDVVTGETRERDAAFRRVVNCETTLVQVKVIREGVDLPLRRCIDLAPTMSPVEFLQSRIGRITRPVSEGESPPEYICTNRNLLRHSYLLEGLLPSATYRECVAKFPAPSTRRLSRVIGFEGLGKFTTTDIPLHGGLTGTLVCVSAADRSGVTSQYAAVASPLHSDVLYAKRVNERKPDGTAYGRWVEIPEIPDLTGFGSVPSKPLSDKQRAWWQRAARFYGLDADADVSSRAFAVLPILKDCSMRFR